jgi:hypothetical protein
MEVGAAGPSPSPANGWSNWWGRRPGGLLPLFFIFSVMIGWPEQLVAAGLREDVAFVFFIFL